MFGANKFSSVEFQFTQLEIFTVLEIPIGRELFSAEFLHFSTVHVKLGVEKFTEQTNESVPINEAQSNKQYFNVKTSFLMIIIYWGELDRIERRVEWKMKWQLDRKN